MAEDQQRMTGQVESRLPRVTIEFCTQCKWMLRAAYVRLSRVPFPSLPPLKPHPTLTSSANFFCPFSHEQQYAQELLSTFNLTLGEVALQPSTGGTFIVTIVTSRGGDGTTMTTTMTTPSSSVLWDRKVDGGFPETKELKRRVRDVVEPGRNLGHVDRDHGAERERKKKQEEEERQRQQQEKEKEDVTDTGGACEDCK